MARTRSILVDSTLGKIFTNTESVATAEINDLIAGTKLQTKSFQASKKTAVRVLQNAGATGTGLNFATNSLITSVEMGVATAPKGSDIQIQIKTGTDYDTASTVGTYTLLANQKSSTTATSISVAENNSIFMDIIQAGSTSPGIGLAVKFKYYAG